jgi:hypothetical protein
LRKAGYRFHTTAEREIVRTIKEQACYIPINFLREEKDLVQYVDFKLPDGNIIKVSNVDYDSIIIYIIAMITNEHDLNSLALSDSAHPRFYSIPRLLV